MKRVWSMKHAIHSFRTIFNSGTVINGDYITALYAWRDSPIANRLEWHEYTLYWYVNGAGRVILEACVNYIELADEKFAVDDEQHYAWVTFDNEIELEEWFVRCLTKANRDWTSPLRETGTIWDRFKAFGRVVKNGVLSEKCEDIPFQGVNSMAFIKIA